MLEIRNLYAGYPGKKVLKGICADIPAKKITVVCGPNGCGKSTLLKTVCGILSPETGEIRLDDQSLLTLPGNLLAQRIAYLAQSRQIPEITVERLVLQGRFPYLHYPRRYRREDYAAAQRALERMDIADLAQTPMSELSGGQRQKAYIAMALAQNAQVLLLDEPTTYLDVSHQLQLMQLARALADMGKTVVMVVHDLSLALQHGDQLLLLSEGQVAARGTPEEVFASGCIDEVFGVKLRRVHTETGWQYYCTSAE